MSRNQTAEGVEAEAARVRAQLIDFGADLRAHADPTVIVDAAKASFARRSKDVPRFLEKNASPILLVLVGGALGATVTGLFASSKRRPRASEAFQTKSDANATPSAIVRPPTKAQLEAALLSTASVGLGYVAGMFIPNTPLEEKYLGAPKAAVSTQLNGFLEQHMQSMKLAAANLFGVSRLSAAALIGLAVAAETLGVTRRQKAP